MENTQRKAFNNYKAKTALEFAHECKEKGFDAYVAEEGTYGFCTNGVRVVSFAMNLNLCLSGNYEPRRQSGTGWRMDDGTGIEEAMQTNAPKWTGNHDPIYMTPEKYLETYQSSSRFTKI
jgi:hypothetical protein